MRTEKKTEQSGETKKRARLSVENDGSKMPDDILEILMKSCIRVASSLSMTSKGNKQLAIDVIREFSVPEAVFVLPKSRAIEPIFNQLKTTHQAGPPIHLTTTKYSQTMTDIRKVLLKYETQITRYSFLVHITADTVVKSVNLFNFNDSKKINFYVFCLSLNTLASLAVSRLYALASIASKKTKKANALKIAGAGGIPVLVALASKGTDGQKEHAAGTLFRLAFMVYNSSIIADAGGIPVLVALASKGTDDQKEHAAGALWYLAGNADNQVKIAEAGGIPVLVALASKGTDGQKEHAAGALCNLANNNADNQVKIAEAGGIPVLVALASKGTDGQKEHAAYALWYLADNADNQVKIAEAGGIKPLVTLATEGTEKQKERAVGALATLSVNDDNRKLIADAGGIHVFVASARQRIKGVKKICGDECYGLTLISLYTHDANNRKLIEDAGGIPVLVDLASKGTKDQKKQAAGLLRNLGRGVDGTKFPETRIILRL